jgi:hypothetical protein
MASQTVILFNDPNKSEFLECVGAVKDTKFSPFFQPITIVRCLLWDNPKSEASKIDDTVL